MFEKMLLTEKINELEKENKELKKENEKLRLNLLNLKEKIGFKINGG